MPVSKNRVAHHIKEFKMKNLHAALSMVLGILLILIVGCIPPLTVNPLYTEKDIVYDPDIAGLWSKDNLKEAWQFTKSAGDFYNLKILSEDGTSYYVVYLFKIKDILYMDAYPDLKWIISNEKNPNMLMIPAHLFLQVKKAESELELTALDQEWLAEYIKDHPDAIPYEMIFDEKHLDSKDIGPLMLITASTEKLQNFVIKIQTIKDAFDKGVKVKLQRSKH